MLRVIALITLAISSSISGMNKFKFNANKTSFTQNKSSNTFKTKTFSTVKEKEAKFLKQQDKLERLINIERTINFRCGDKKCEHKGSLLKALGWGIKGTGLIGVEILNTGICLATFPLSLASDLAPFDWVPQIKRCYGNAAFEIKKSVVPPYIKFFAHQKMKKEIKKNI